MYDTIIEIYYQRLDHDLLGEFYIPGKEPVREKECKREEDGRQVVVIGEQKYDHVREQDEHHSRQQVIELPVQHEGVCCHLADEIQNKRYSEKSKVIGQP